MSTPEGSAQAQGDGAPTTLQELWARIAAKLNGPQSKLFDYLVRRKRGEEIGRTELAEHTGYTESSGTFRNLLS